MNIRITANVCILGVCALLHSSCNKLPFLPPKAMHYFSYEEIDNYTSASDLVMNGATITNNLKVTGKFEGSNSSFNNVSLNGNSNIANSIIEGDVNVNGTTVFQKVTISKPLQAFGSLKIINSWLQQPIDFQGTFLRLHDTDVPSIKVRHANTESVLEIHGKTIVRGDIIFESGKGKVFIEKHAKVLGTIKGATTELEEELEINLS